jgi:lipopolysaccharide transport system ATP-binding protein
MTKVISIENLGKSYMIGHQGHGQRYVALRDIVSNAGRKLWSRIIHPEYYTHENIEEFWALQDINLDINEGDRLGIIGRNGAGKTTLLKLLSRITSPTKGQIKIKGRVASLLEVGTGFHPELTGRENVFLNGAILGMTRQEIRMKFDEIVDFAGVENFLDTPVKRYSSGMHVRLGFSVAAHLEPEILVVDEVLAVGDAAFQKKCVGKMNSVAKEGRTILFVSHQMEAIANLCNRCVLLNNGKVRKIGETPEIINDYLTINTTDDVIPLSQRRDRSGDGRMRFTNTWIENEKGKRLKTVQSGQTITIVLIYEVIGDKPLKDVQISMGVNTLTNINVTELCNNYSGYYFNKPIPRQGRIDCILPRLPLNKGRYTYNVMADLGLPMILDYVMQAGEFDVEGGDYFGTGKTTSDDKRLVLLNQEWSLKEAIS